MMCKGLCSRLIPLGYAPPVGLTPHHAAIMSSSLTIVQHLGSVKVGRLLQPIHWQQCCSMVEEALSLVTSGNASFSVSIGKATPSTAGCAFLKLVVFAMITD
jgi:hypothetical protein